jgi:hypothetical protein
MSSSVAGPTSRPKRPAQCLQYSPPLHANLHGSSTYRTAGT